MKLKTLIKKLQALETRGLGDHAVVLDEGCRLMELPSRVKVSKDKVILEIGDELSREDW